MRTPKYIYSVALLCLLLSSCSVAVKRCKAPELNLPREVVADQMDSITIADVKWWEFYGDEVLGGFISHALESNKDLLAPRNTAPAPRPWATYPAPVPYGTARP